jgi:hypothetical protein
MAMARGAGGREERRERREERGGEGVGREGWGASRELLIAELTLLWLRRGRTDERANERTDGRTDGSPP